MNVRLFVTYIESYVKQFAFLCLLGYSLLSPTGLLFSVRSRFSLTARETGRIITPKAWGVTIKNGKKIHRCKVKQAPEIQVSGGSTLFPLRAQARLYA